MASERLNNNSVQPHRVSLGGNSWGPPAFYRLHAYLTHLREGGSLTATPRGRAAGLRSPRTRRGIAPERHSRPGGEEVEEEGGKQRRILSETTSSFPQLSFQIRNVQELLTSASSNSKTKRCAYPKVRQT